MRFKLFTTAAAVVVIEILLQSCLWRTSLVRADVGTATTYSPPYLPTRCNGYREDQFPPGNLFVAVSQGLWDNGAACGRRYRLRCLSGPRRPCRRQTIDVQVVDLCSQEPCPSTIVMSNDAFALVSRSQRRKINIEYVEI